MTGATTPRLADLVRLAAGRASFRLSVQLMAVVVALIWGAEQFGRYANAMGLFVWLTFLPTAAEKAALKILPRTRLLTPRVAALTLWLATTPVVLLLLALGVAALVGPHSTVTLYLAAASWSAATGLLMTISGLHRLCGRPLRDAGAFAVVTAVVLAGTLITWLAGLAPTAHLAVLLAGLLVVLARSLTALPGQWLRPGAAHRDRRLLPAFGRSVWLLGLSELLGVLALSAVYLVLALSGRTTDSGPLYLALLVSSMIGSFLLYQLKLHQPAASARLRGTAGATGRQRARHLLGLAERAGAGFALLIVACLAIPAVRAELLADDLGHYVLLGGILVVEIGLSIVFLYANFIVENTNSRVLRLTSTTAVINLAATVLLAVALVPWLGAAGALITLVIAAAVRSGTLRRMLSHPDRSSPNSGASHVRSRDQ